MAATVACYRSVINGYELCDHRRKQISRRVGESFANFSSSLGTFSKEIYSTGTLFFLYFFLMASS
jgi:hypothetical protein